MGRRDQLADLVGELQHMKKNIEGNDAPAARNLLALSPFSQDILAYEAPKDFKALDHASYDGTEDPRDHLLGFQAKMLVVEAAGQMMCRAFFPTLMGSAQQWFMSLPSGSIHNFEGLVEGFLTHFVGSMRSKRHFTHLTTVK